MPDKYRVRNGNMCKGEKETLLAITGQEWKYRLFVIGLVGGVLFIVLGLAHGEYPRAAQMVGLGLVIGVTSVVFFMTSLRCPECDARWAWRAAARDDQSTWPLSVVQATECPNCGYGGESEMAQTDQE